MRRPSKGTVRFLPVLILVLLAVLPAHVGSLWTGAVKLAMAEDAAKAAQTPPAAAPAASTDAAAAPAGQSSAAAQPAPSAAAAPATAPAAASAPAGGAAAADSGSAVAFDPLTLTKSEIDVLQQLAKRR